MNRVDQQPISTPLPPPATQPENKSCGIMNIALPIIAALAGFVFLPFEIAIVLTGVVAIGTLLCCGCIDGESIKKVGTLIPRWSEREPGRIYWTPGEQKTSTPVRSSGPMPREHEPVDHESSGSSMRSAPTPMPSSGSAYPSPLPEGWSGSSSSHPGSFVLHPPRHSYGRNHMPNPIGFTGAPEREPVDSSSPPPPMMRADHPTRDLHKNEGPKPRPLPHAPHANRRLGSFPPGGPSREEVDL